MTRFGWSLLSVLARALEPAERDVVLGDLAESGEGVGAATRHLLGLIVRRQVGLWLSWRPWLALLGVSCLAGLSLSRIVFRLNVDLHKHASGLRDQLDCSPGSGVLALPGRCVTVWSWTCGFVLGSLSGRAVWLTWSVFYFVVLDSAWARFVLRAHHPAQPAHPRGPLDSLPGTLRLLMATPSTRIPPSCSCFLPCLGRLRASGGGS
jgi:hypothetical protein